MLRFIALLLLAIGCSPSAVAVGADVTVSTLSMPAVPVFDRAILDNAAVAAAGYVGQTSNINQPHLTEPPSWARGLVDVAPVWLFFSDHNGHEIRAAYATSIETLDWTIVPPSHDIPQTLSLAKARLVTGLTDPPYGSSNNQFSAPYIVWDDDVRIGYCFDDRIITDGANEGWKHGAGCSVTGEDLSGVRALMKALGHDPTLVDTYITDVPALDVGKKWRPLPQQLGSGETGNPSYLRPWIEIVDGVKTWYATSNTGDPRRCESSPGVVDSTGLSKYRSLADPNSFTNAINNNNTVPIRHCMRVALDALFFWYFYSRPQESSLDPLVPEHIRAILIDRRGAWGTWFATGAAYTVRTSLRPWEGSDIAIVAKPTAIPGAQHIILDPYVYISRSGVIYLLCAVMGEQGIGLYRLSLTR